MKNEQKFNEWTATHSAWFLFCPIYLAELDSEAPVPLPRKWVPDWYFDLNFWLNDMLQHGIALISPESVGFMFYRARELKAPKIIKVKAE